MSLRIAIFDYIDIPVPVIPKYKCLLRYLEHIHQFFVCLAFSILLFSLSVVLRCVDVMLVFLCVTLSIQILNILLFLSKHHLNNSRLICLGIFDLSNVILIYCLTFICSTSQRVTILDFSFKL